MKKKKFKASISIEVWDKFDESNTKEITKHVVYMATCIKMEAICLPPHYDQRFDSKGMKLSTPTILKFELCAELISVNQVVAFSTIIDGWLMLIGLHPSVSHYSFFLIDPK